MQLYLFLEEKRKQCNCDKWRTPEREQTLCAAINNIDDSEELKWLLALIVHHSKNIKPLATSEATKHIKKKQRQSVSSYYLDESHRPTTLPYGGKASENNRGFNVAFENLPDDLFGCLYLAVVTFKICSAPSSE